MPDTENLHVIIECNLSSGTTANELKVLNDITVLLVVFSHKKLTRCNFKNQLYQRY